MNFGIVPLTFENSSSYDEIDQGDKLEVIINDLTSRVVLKNITKDKDYNLNHTLSKLDSEILKAGGKLTWIKTQL